MWSVNEDWVAFLLPWAFLAVPFILVFWVGFGIGQIRARRKGWDAGFKEGSCFAESRFEVGRVEGAEIMCKQVQKMAEASERLAKALIKEKEEELEEKIGGRQS